MTDLYAKRHIIQRKVCKSFLYAICQVPFEIRVYLEPKKLYEHEFFGEKLMILAMEQFPNALGYNGRVMGL